MKEDKRKLLCDIRKKKLFQHTSAPNLNGKERKRILLLADYNIETISHLCPTQKAIWRSLRGRSVCMREEKCKRNLQKKMEMKLTAKRLTLSGEQQ